MEALNEFLATHSYLGGDAGVTLEDYKKLESIKAGSFNESTLQHLSRWYTHVSFLKSKYPKFDHLGNAIPAGKAAALGGGSSPKSSPKNKPAAKASPKKEAAPSPKKEAAPKKAAAPKKEAAAKKETAPKEEKKAAEPAKEAAEKMLKKVLKEGGKRGVEIEGAADMGGLQFFCTSVDEPQGDIAMLKESLNAMNADGIPGEEERRGCSGHIGKTIFSCGVDQLAVAAYVPEAKLGELSCEEWLAQTLSIFQGEVVEKGKQLCIGIVRADSDKGIFPLKIREAMILEANNFLRKKGLFPEDKDSDDEMVFGDDDFPS